MLLFFSDSGTKSIDLNTEKYKSFEGATLLFSVLRALQVKKMKVFTILSLKNTFSLAGLQVESSLQTHSLPCSRYAR